MNDKAADAARCSSRSVRNPILRGFHPDPSILRVGDTYYIATSTFEWYPGVRILRSSDLATWEHDAWPLDEKRLLDLTGVPDSCGIWAPCLSWADDRFWLCYTIVRRFDGDFKDAHNYLTTCPTVDGRWSDPVHINSSGFDPSLFHDDDGRKWHMNMVWDHRPGHNRFGGIVMQEYSHEQSRLVGKPVNVFEGSPAGLTEGPHVYKRDGWYYLLTAEGGTGYEHAATMARSRDILGPYEIDPERHLITAADKPDAPLQRTGHGSLVETEAGDWYFAHLCSRPFAPSNRYSVLGRETALQPVTWSEDGWLRLADRAGAFVAATDHPLEDVEYRFESPSLPYDFQWLRTPDHGRLFSLTDEPGVLRLYGRESIGSLYESALVARRQQHFNYVAETRMRFAPDTFQQLAGLTAYYNAHKFHYLFVSCDDGGNLELGIMSCAADQSLTVDYAAFGIEPPASDQGWIWLRARVEGVALQFSFSGDGENWTYIGPTLDASILSDEAGKTEHGNFTGAFVGMTCQDVSGQGQHADFDLFRYREF
jgi:xylan 1,4-beta-xylosidase